MCALYFFVRYASCSMRMRCVVLLANQRWGELPGQLGEGLGRTGGGAWENRWAGGAGGNGWAGACA